MNERTTYINKALILILIAFTLSVNNSLCLEDSLKGDDLMTDEPQLAVMIGQMIITGFRGLDVDKESLIVRDIQDYHLGGVVLFNYDTILKSYERNITGKEQLRNLTSSLSSYSHYPLFISIDQEGGMITRLNERNGFQATLSAGKLGTINDLQKTEEQGRNIGKSLAETGININFAPVIDLNINPDNPIIARWERSFSDDPQTVTAHATAFIKGLREYGIISSLKHFPGHGSSTEDSHLGITDISNTWKEVELLPYRTLIADGYADTIMTGHLVNRDLDDQYPAALSKKTVTGVLREQLGYEGVIISDDLGMKAITDHYSLKETVYLAIESGTDILLFGNNMDYDENIVPKVHEMIMTMVEEGKISESRIRESFERIISLKKRL